MPKPKIHPTWFKTAPVLCDGKPLSLVGSTKSALKIDMWLFNHPFYTKSQVIINREGPVERFLNKYDFNSTDQ